MDRRPHIIKDYSTEKGVEITLHENRFFAMKFNGYFHYLDPVKYGRGVVMVPRFDNGDLLLVRLRRAPAIGFSLEFPRGGVDAGEALEVAAQREVSEETGYSVPLSAVRRLGKLAQDTATLNSMADAYLVDIPADVPAGSFDTEEIDRPIRMSESAFRKMATNGEIVCGVTLAAYTLMKLHLES
jgi:ADP-ribose pyrophosphatase